ncbi:MAG: 23S rRNA (guanosine(2251)-2'-O)-methyltransferase RlmB [Burkholderiaceae bacterium]|jgi:23S rRNA (guanosine2251-2'-O)-methyltransferase|nr:23S rRNA (guanosine(2251)-2'-O)-methyltransferase RlmB [Burkholderiaceae bacterium]
MAKNIVLAGFHAVGARLRKDPDSLVSVYVDRERRDKRMVEMRKQLEEAGVRVMLADHARLSGMVSREIPHQGIVAMAREIETGMSFDELMDQIGPDSLFLILDGVTDPRNFGACLRSADAAGATAVIIPKDRSASVTPAAAKAAAGAAESIPVVQVTNLAAAIVELRDAGVTVVGAAGETDKTIYDYDQTGAFAWVMGAEGPGLRQLTRKRCDGLAAIPLLGSVESLNVSVATGICLYEAVRQRTMKKLGRKA